MMIVMTITMKIMMTIVPLHSGSPPLSSFHERGLSRKTPSGNIYKHQYQYGNFHIFIIFYKFINFTIFWFFLPIDTWWLVVIYIGNGIVIAMFVISNSDDFVSIHTPLIWGSTWKQSKARVWQICQLGDGEIQICCEAPRKSHDQH